MTDSAQTIQLRKDLLAVQEKIRALNSASSTLSSVKIDFKTAKEDIDSLHVAGEAYDVQKNKEEESLESIKKDLTTRQSEMAGNLALEISALGLRADSLASQLAYSIAEDQRRAREAEEEK